MNCIEFRQKILSDPYSESALADAHRDNCERCREFEDEISNLDGNINQAMSVEVPEGLAARVMLNHSLQQTPRKPTRRLWLSMAASLFAATVIAYQVFFQQNGMQEPILAHADHQPHEFYSAEHLPISNDQLESVLGAFNASGSIENVVYASICPLNGERAAHLVIKDGEDQYTVMLIPDRSPGKVFEMNNAIWRGFVSPHPAGALAVLADASHLNAVARLETMRTRFQDSVYLSAEL